ncbi:MAG: FGGY-family carbohydrate kinase [Spirochaetales bacterium]|nr:FGGY-family carbohydrate kinase [Spirochaetales bacterium]
MILAVDIGTTSLKGGLFTGDGSLEFLDRLILPHSEEKGFDPEWWFECFIGFLSRFSAQGGDLSSVEGVVLSGHGPTLVALGGDSLPVAPALMWNENKSQSVKGESFYLPLVAWFRDVCPDLYQRTDVFLGCSEYLLYRLTGVRAAVSSGPPFDSYIWTPKMLDENGFDQDKFPACSYLGDKTDAFLTPEAARLTGLLSGLPVYGAGSDFFTSLLGSGAVQSGVVCDRAGTSEGLNMIVPGGVNHDHIRFLPHPSSREGLFNGSVILSSTGSLFEWYRRLTGQDSWSYHKTMEGILSSGRQGLPWFFPSLNDGGLWEFSGGMLLGIDPAMDRFRLGRSVLEAIGFALKRGLSLLEEEGGAARRIVAVGGQAKSPLWNRMKADMLDRPIEVPLVADAELLGGLVVFLVGEGAFSSLKEGALALYRSGGVFVPQESGWYRERFAQYRELAEGVGSFYKDYRGIIRPF